MEFRQLQHFLAVAEEGNFHRAAARVHLTQQAVSKSLAQLEAKLGVRLLDRDRQSVVLTAFGELLLPHARTVTAEVRQFDDSLAAMLGTRTGALRIGATPTPMSHLLPAALRRLRLSKPKLKIAVEQGDFTRLSGLLLQGQLEAVLSSEPPQPWDELLKIEQVGEDHNVVALRAGHPLTALRKPSPAQLNDFPWLAITNFPKAEADVRGLFSGSGIKPIAPTMTTSSVNFATTWIAGSDFICVLPRRLVERELAEGRLTTLDLKLKPRRWPLVLATRGNATRTPATLAFIEAVKAVAAKGSSASDPSPGS